MVREQTQDWFDAIHWRRFAAWLAAGILLMLLILFVWHRLEEFLIDDVRFRVSAPDDFGNASPNLIVEGVRYASASQIRHIFAEDLGRSLYLAPIQERRSELLQIDWIENATVSKVWPNTLRVTVQERVPVAFVHLPPRRDGLSEFALIDKDGYILRPRIPARFTLPVIAGISESEPLENRRARIHRVLALLGAIGPLGAQISEINVADPNNLVIAEHIDNRVLNLELGDENYAERLKNFLANYREIEAKRPDAQTLDLRVDGVITAVGEHYSGR
jgi:cell division protein FtsQ